MIRRKMVMSVISLFALGFLSACGALSSGMEMGKANKLVEEANAANVEAAKSIEESNKRFAQLFSSDVDLDDRKKFEPTAKDALDSLNKAHAKLLEAIQKLETASKLDIEDWYKTYLTTMAQSYRNTDQRADVLKDMAKLYMDYTLDVQSLNSKYKELVDKDNKLEKDSADIDVKIKKIEADNKDRMKS